MSLLEETIYRMRVRALLQRHGVGRLLRDGRVLYDRRGDYYTKYTDGNTRTGRRLLQQYKHAAKAVVRWRAQSARSGALAFAVEYCVPSNTRPGRLHVAYISAEAQDADETEF